MKIATWNIERLKHKYKINDILNQINDLKADILVLTETDSRINLSNFKNRFDTPKLIEIDSKMYSETENRVSIFTNYEIVNQHETIDEYTSLCVELKTENGNLIIYGTIVGIYGNRNENFKIDLIKQINDFEALSNNNICIAGDFNISFSDNYYFTNYGRSELNKAFETNNLELLTRQTKNCIDHIAISKNFIKGKEIEIKEWNENKELSDHKGIIAEIK